MSERLPPMLRFFGSKWRSAPKYPEPECDMIVEPFAGGAGYSLAHSERKVILVDRSEQIVGIWKWLIAADPKEILALPLLAPGEVIPESLRDEARWLIGFWGTICAVKPQRRVVPSAARIPSSFWNEKIRARIAASVERIRHWRVLGPTDALDLLDVGWNPWATWFVDPPYFGRERYGQPPLDYERLGEFCRTRRGQVIVCEAQGATWLPFQPHLSVHAAPRAQWGGDAAKRSAEVIWHRRIGE